MKTTMKAVWGERLNNPITTHGNSAQIVLEQISAGTILGETILEFMGWEEATKIEIQVSEDSIVLMRRLRASATDATESQRNNSARPPAAD
jgi:antitoxin component of MazEF toxin-antitoxin module